MRRDRASTGHNGGFVDRLGELILLSFAAGQTVEGERYLVNGHRMVPDVSVSIERMEGDSESRTRDGRPEAVLYRGGRSEEVTITGTDRRAFDVKLESFLLTEFARGESIAGIWELRYDRAELPAWTVKIDLGDVDFEADPDAFTLRSRGVY